MARTSETHPIRVDFIKSETHPILNLIGITLAPGKKQATPFSGEAWDRDVHADLSRMRDVYGLNILVSLLELSEYRELGVEDIPRHCQSLGIRHHMHPIVDGSIPRDRARFDREIRNLSNNLAEGKRIVIHCKGGLGRAALTAACLVIHASRGVVSAKEAIELVQQARGQDAINDLRQQKFIDDYHEEYIGLKHELEASQPEMKSDKNELVFLIKKDTHRVGVLRFPAGDGRWFYFYKVVDSIRDNDGDLPGFGYERIVSEPFGTYDAALENLFIHGEIFDYVAEFIHRDYFAESREVFERKIARLSDEERMAIVDRLDCPLTFASWLEKSEERSEENDLLDESGFELVDQPSIFERTERNFLLYWQFHSIVNTASHSRALDLISSRQLGRVSSGDRIWIVTVDGNGRLLVAGQMKIGEIVDRDTAIDTIGSDNVWDGELFALPDTSEVPHFIHTVDAHHIAPLLRFGPDGSSAFNLPDGRLSPSDLQMMREVSPESSSHLYELWENSYPFPVAGDEYEDDYDDDLDDDNEDWNEGEGIDADEEMAMELQRLEAEKMIAESKDALRRNPNDAMALYNMGVAYAMLGEPERERDCYNRVLLLEPENEAARFNLGCSFAGQGEVEGAANEFQILVDSGTEMPPAHFMLGSMLAQLGREEEGIRALRRGLQYDPEDGQAYFNIGRALMSLGRFSEAISEFEKAKNLGFDDIEMCLLLGMCYRETGEKRKELESYLSGLELNAMAMDLIFNAGTVWAHIHGGEEGRAIPYKDFDGNFMLDDAPTTFYFGLGLIATGVIDEAKGCVEDIGGPTTELGGKLARMIRIAESL
jgi:tetratricopeptide (TPR) repeat protein/protein-tyrosine phosphatase